METQNIGEIQIMFGTVLFGLQTVLSRAAMEMSIGPFTFNALVLVFGSIFLGLARKPLLRISQLGDEDVEEEEEVYQIEKKYFYFADTLRHYFPVSLSATDESLELLVWSVLFGLIHFCANTCTQIGLVTVQATTSGFITSLYVVFTPLLLAALTPLIGSPMGEINKATFVAAWISLIGSYVLLGCNTGDQTNCEASLSDGELITIIGAVLWAVSIIVSDLGVSHVNCIDLTFYGTIVCGIISLIAAFIMEYELMVSCVFSMQASSWLLCVSVGVVEVLAYALDLLGQMNTTGARAALLMSLDSVVTAIGAYFFLHESLSQIQFIGCLLMLTSTFVSSTQEKIHVLDETGRTTLTLVGGRYFISEWRPRQRMISRTRSLSFTHLEQEVVPFAAETLAVELGLEHSESIPLLVSRDEIIKQYSSTHDLESMALSI